MVMVYNNKWYIFSETHLAWRWFVFVCFLNLILHKNVVRKLLLPFTGQKEVSQNILCTKPQENFFVIGQKMPHLPQQQGQGLTKNALLELKGQIQANKRKISILKCDKYTDKLIKMLFFPSSYPWLSNISLYNINKQKIQLM